MRAPQSPPARFIFENCEQLAPTVNASCDHIREAASFTGQQRDAAGSSGGHQLARERWLRALSAEIVAASIHLS
jgi:hypothetical protein